MDDFSAQPGAPNAFGLIGAFANAVAPGKRPLSSMTPTIVTKDGTPILCVGAAGGPTIVSATVQTIVNVIDFGLDVSAAVAAPRIHAQWMPNALVVEPDVPRDVVKATGEARAQGRADADAWPRCRRSRCRPSG